MAKDQAQTKLHREDYFAALDQSATFPGLAESKIQVSNISLAEKNVRSYGRRNLIDELLLELDD